MSALHWSGLLRRAKQRLAAQKSIIVLTFHRVLPAPEFEKTFSPLGMVMREETFEETLRYASRQYESVELRGQSPDHKETSAKLSLAFTFDDGWLDNARYAVPIAHKYHVPLTIFVCPGRMGVLFPFWPERIAALCQEAGNAGSLDQVAALIATRTGQKVIIGSASDTKAVTARVTEILKTIPASERKEIISALLKTFGPNANANVSELDATMSWEEVERLSNEGVNFGSHTHTHQILTMLPADSIERELSESKREIEEQLSRPCSVFAYPNGNWSTAAKALVAKAGYSLAFLNVPGVWARDTDPLLIPRVNIWEGTVVDLRGRFSPVAFDYAVFWRALQQYKKSHRRWTEQGAPAEQPVSMRANTAN